MRALLLATVLLAACQEPPAVDAEEAYDRLLSACDKNDAARLFDALDTPTQWSIESVQHDQRDMKRLILETYPPADRDRALARIPVAAEEDVDHPRRYFRRLERSPEILRDVCKRLYAGKGQPSGSLAPRASGATVWRDGGSVFHFAPDDKGRWGWAELRAEWENAKLRSTHDLATVRENAAIYRKMPSPH